MSNTMAFGAGVLFGINTAAGSTPIKFGALQDVSIEISANSKELMGANQFALAVARGASKISGKAKSGVFNARMLNELFFNQTLSTGMLLLANDELGTITAAAVVVANNGANFDSDLGVIDAATGESLMRVANAPAAGQYSVNATGNYGFAAADNGKQVLVSYLYRSAASGNTIDIRNTLQGQAPTFKGVFSTSFQGKQVTLVLNACVTSKFGFASKNEDFSIPEFDFQAQADAAGRVGTLSIA